MDQLSLLSQEPHASHSVSPDSARDWMMSAATWHSSIFDFLIEHGPVGWFGRTSPESFQQPPTHLPISVERTYEWKVEPPDPMTGVGLCSPIGMKQSKAMPSGASWPDYQTSGMGGPTGFLTLSTQEYPATLVPFPNDGSACSLSDILEGIGAHLLPYYMLSLIHI